jgi:hypothetical protein
MVAPPEISRNTQLGKAKAAPGGEVPKGAARGIIKAGARKPRPDKRRAMGRIEHTLLVGGWLHLNRPKTFAHSPLATPPYHKKLQMFLFTTKGRDLYRDPGPALMRRSGQDGGGEVPADLCATKLTLWPLNVVNDH